MIPDLGHILCILILSLLFYFDIFSLFSYVSLPRDNLLRLVSGYGFGLTTSGMLVGVIMI